MLITSKLKIDLRQPGFKQVAYAVQSDSNTRALEISLFLENTPWEIPLGTTAAVSFRKMDLTSGLYDTLPDGSTKAVTFSGNTLTAILAPQVLTCAGKVDISIALYDSDLNRLGVFPILLYVSTDPSAGKSISNNYYYLSTLAAVNEAIGNLNDLKTATKESLVAAINEVISLGGGTITDDQIQAAVDKYLEANPPEATPIDTTLTREGYAADAKATGEAISGTSSQKVASHNVDTDAHNDIRLELKALSDRLTAFFDSDDTTLDELSEIVSYITNNKTLIESITTSKVNVTDIVNNLTTNVANKPLSAAQGVVLKGLIDSLTTSLSRYQPKGDYALNSAIPTKVGQLENDSGYLTEHQDISGKLDASALPTAINTALAQAKASGEFDGEKGEKGDKGDTGDTGATGATGAAGKDGTSPVISVAAITGGHRITITDVNGVKTFDVLDGEDGQDLADNLALPAYYDEYIAGKVAKVKALMEEAGPNASTFLCFTDSHDVDTQNAPLLAKKIMDECHIHRVFHLGDMERYSATSEANAKESLDRMLCNMRPIEDDLLVAIGNHDGAWGETDQHLIPKNAIYSHYHIMNKGKADGYGADQAYCFMDDAAEKTRYILLNSHDYPDMSDTERVPILRQAQYDWLKDALNVDDGWSVICFCHVPPVLSYATKSPNLAMLDDVLGAYRNKTTYEGSYAGAFGETTQNYTNLFDKSGVLINQRFNSSIALVSGNGAFVTNTMPTSWDASGNMVIRVKGYPNAIGTSGNDKIQGDEHSGWGAQLNDASSGITIDTSDLDNQVITIPSKYNAWTNFRLSLALKSSAITAADVPDLIITVNEPIESVTTGAWDALDIDYDFSSYKGEFIGLWTGHTHNDNLWNAYPVTAYKCHIVGVCADAGRLDDRSYNDAETYPEYGGRAAGTVYENCLDVVVVNRETKTVKILRVGAGDRHKSNENPAEAEEYNRSFTY